MINVPKIINQMSEINLIRKLYRESVFSEAFFNVTFKNNIFCTTTL